MELSVKNFYTFVDSTTAHGFSRVSQTRSLPVKFMWLIFLIAAISGFGYHITQLLIQFLSIPISANISPNSIPFDAPDISVCSVSPISYTNFHETITKHPHVYNYQLLATASQIITQTLSKGYSYDPKLLLQISRDTFSSSLILYYMGHRKEYFITSCLYKGFRCSFTDFTIFYSSRYANCFLFRPSDALVNRTAHIAEFRLDLVLFSDAHPTAVIDPFAKSIYSTKSAAATFEGDVDVTKSGGVILYYGSKGEYPRNFINLSPGTHSYVNFQMVAFKFVNRRNKPCNSENSTIFYEDSNGNRISFRKNQQDCQHKNLLNEIVDKCRCLSTRIAPWYEDRKESYSLVRCQFFNASTNATEFDKRRLCESNLIDRKSTLFNDMKECIPNCEERIYTPIISMSTWPLDPLTISCKDQIIGDSIRELQAHNITVPDSFYYFKNNITEDNFIQFSANFAQLSIGAYGTFATQITEEFSYEFFNLFSDIGGILGLYLGMSMLTVCEIFELCLVLIGECREVHHALKKREQLKDKKKNFVTQLVDTVKRPNARIVNAVRSVTKSDNNNKSQAQEKISPNVARFPSVSELVMKNNAKKTLNSTSPPKITRVKPVINQNNLPNYIP